MNDMWGNPIQNPQAMAGTMIGHPFNYNTLAAQQAQGLASLIGQRDAIIDHVPNYNPRYPKTRKEQYEMADQMQGYSSKKTNLEEVWLCRRYEQDERNKERAETFQIKMRIRNLICKT